MPALNMETSTMLNRAPIFVNGFQRGGTNILMNLIASHPDVALLSGETHQIFLGKPDENFKKWIDRMFYIPVVLFSGRHLFDPHTPRERGPAPRPVQRYLDATFYWS